MTSVAKRSALAFGFLAAITCSGQALACPPEPTVDAFVTAWTAKTPVSPPFGTNLTSVDANCAQDMVVAKLSDTIGAPVGFKVAVTDASATNPQAVLGVMLEGMLLDNGVQLSPNYGAKPVVSAGIAFVIGDIAINTAGTPEEALQSISSIQPYIDLGDQVVTDPSQATAAVMTSVDAGARLGVLGAETPLDTSPAGIDALGAMDVVVTDGTGKTLSTTPGSAMMGNPLNALLWTVKALSSRGTSLREGDIVAITPYSTPEPPVAGQILTVAYNGLQGNPTVTVTFNDE